MTKQILFFICFLGLMFYEVLGGTQQEKIMLSKQQIALSKIQPPKVIEENPWKVATFITSGDSDNVLQVVYHNELGFRITNFCMVLFESKSEYKLVAPWLGSGKVLQKSNITDLVTVKIPKSQKKDEE